MRFCMITTFYPPYHFGGDATYVRALSRALVELGHSVDVVHCVDAFTLKGGVIRHIESARDGINVHRLKSAFGWLSPLITQQTGHPGLKTIALRSILANDYDVVHFHNVSLIGGPAIVSFSRAPVTLYSLHEHWLMCPTHIFWKDRVRPCDTPSCISCSLRSGIPPQVWRYGSFTQRHVDKADLLLSPSKYTAERHRLAGLNVPIKVLPLFSALSPEVILDRPAGQPRFLYVGRVTAPKGIAELCELFADMPAFHLDVIGDGELLGTLQSKFGSCPNILFCGQVLQTELSRAYARATALVSPSLAPETFGLSVVEAFACSTPVIVSNAGGTRELVETTGGGIIYDNANGLRKALERLSTDAELRYDLGQKARLGYEQHYTKEKHIANYLGHIEDVMACKKVTKFVRARNHHIS